LTLVDDVAQIDSCSPLQSSVPQFDAIICIGNSFPHLPDTDGTMSNQRLAISNFIELLNPGGLLVIDHRNYDEILRTGVVHQNKVSLHVSATPFLFQLNYEFRLKQWSNGAGWSTMFHLDLMCNFFFYLLAIQPSAVDATHLSRS